VSRRKRIHGHNRIQRSNTLITSPLKAIPGKTFIGKNVEREAEGGYKDPKRPAMQWAKAIFNPLGSIGATKSLIQLVKEYGAPRFKQGGGMIFASPSIDIEPDNAPIGPEPSIPT